MKYVEIKTIQNDGGQKTAVICSFDKGVVKILGDQKLTTELINDGIYDYSNKKERIKLYPTDGLRFLEQLKYNFKSGYINATDIIDTA